MSSGRFWRGAGVGIAVGMLVVMAMPTGAQTPDQPRLSEPLFSGQVNSSNAVTTLSGSVSGGANLVLSNRAARSPALQLNVTRGAPLVVNSRARVLMLNADLLDGKHARAFALTRHAHDGVYLPVAGVAADSDLLDGLNSTAFAAAVHTQAFASLTGVPAGLGDGDDDTLGGLACPAGEIPKRNGTGTAWECGTDLNPTDADTVDGQHAADFADAGHDHDTAYLGIGSRAADSDLLDGFNSSVFAFGEGGVAFNSELLDGRDWTAFSLAGHNHNGVYAEVVGTPTEGNFPTLTALGELADSLWGPASFSLAGHDHAGLYLPVGGTAVDADLLDGMDSGDFLGATAQAADSLLLGGLDSSAFSLVGHDHA
ncbi:MAG: hypothetical protein ABIJ48_11720, partial [Actinomycetota bacterium]